MLLAEFIELELLSRSYGTEFIKPNLLNCSYRAEVIKPKLFSRTFSHERINLSLIVDVNVLFSFCKFLCKCDMS